MSPTTSLTEQAAANLAILTGMAASQRVVSIATLAWLLLQAVLLKTTSHTAIVLNYLIAEYGSLSESTAQCQLCEKSCSSFCT